MTEMEEMEALKRVYADMILNTAKEAAARVMAAELRARRMEQEVNSTKAEAAEMLLRLKHMIDVKTKEAECTSLNQQKKHDELESQLNEAEGIILDLRAELNQAEEQLYEMKNKKMLTMIQNEENEEELSVKPKDTCSGYELLAPSFNPGSEFGSVGRPSVTYNSESNVYSGENISVLNEINESQTSLVQESSLVGEILLNPSNNLAKTGTVNAAESNSVLEEKVQQNESVSVIRRSLRKRKLKFWGDGMTACGRKGSYLTKKPRQAFPNLACFRGKVKRCVQYGDDQEKDGTKIENINDAGVSKENVHTEALPENMELVDVVVKQDELVANIELTSSLRIECGVECGTATKASNYAEGKRLCRYTFKRKLKKKSMIYNRKWRKKSIV